MKLAIFVFGCGDREPVSWYPDLLVAAGDGGNRVENELLLLPASVICAWCCAEDESRLELQLWLVRSGNRGTHSGGEPRLTPSDEADRRQHSPGWLAYQRRMEKRGSPGLPARKALRRIP